MIALQQNFNDESGVGTAYSAAANEANFLGDLTGENLKTFQDFDNFFRENGNNSNEGTLRVVRDTVDTLNNGRIPVRLTGLGEMIDASTEAREGVDQEKSSDVSGKFRAEEEIEQLVYNTPEVAPVGQTAPELELALFSVYEQLLTVGAEVGIYESDLNSIMFSGRDPSEQMEAFVELTQDKNLPVDVAAYIGDVNQGFEDLRASEVTQKLDLAANEPVYKAEISTQAQYTM